MFNLRLKLKAKENPAQNIVKLMLNSSYGKTIETVHDTESHIKTKDELHPFVLKHSDSIKDEILEVSQKYIVTQLKEVNDQYSHTYIGALVLSVSKRIMN